VSDVDIERQQKAAGPTREELLAAASDPENPMSHGEAHKAALAWQKANPDEPSVFNEMVSAAREARNAAKNAAIAEQKAARDADRAAKQVTEAQAKADRQAARDAAKAEKAAAKEAKLAARLAKKTVEVPAEVKPEVTPAGNEEAPAAQAAELTTLAEAAPAVEVVAKPAATVERAAGPPAISGRAR
jgi:hypothetical protein